MAVDFVKKVIRKKGLKNYVMNIDLLIVSWLFKIGGCSSKKTGALSSIFSNPFQCS